VTALTATRLAALLLGAADRALAQTAASAPRVFAITATATRFEAPAEVAAGPVTFTLVNRARVAVEAQLLAVRDDHTPAEAIELLLAGQPRPDWIVAAGGVGPLAPGLRAGVTQSLPPGSYVVLSLLPDTARVPQYRRGYITGFRATGRGVLAREDSIVAELNVGSRFQFLRISYRNGRRISLGGRELSLATPILRGERALEVNIGQGQSHQIALVRMDSSVVLRHYVAWLAGGQRGRAPGRPWGGVAVTPPGRQVWIRARLEPGTYWLLCTAPHGARRGFETGEYTQFVVR